VREFRGGGEKREKKENTGKRGWWSFAIERKLKNSGGKKGGKKSELLEKEPLQPCSNKKKEGGLSSCHEK